MDLKEVFKLIKKDRALQGFLLPDGTIDKRYVNKANMSKTVQYLMKKHGYDTVEALDFAEILAELTGKRNPMMKKFQQMMMQDKDMRKDWDLGEGPIAAELVKIAKELVAYGKDVESVIRLLKSGGYKWVAFFKKGKPTGKPALVQPVKKIPADKMREYVVEPISLTPMDDALVYTFVGPSGCKETYVFSMVPFEEVESLKIARDLTADDEMEKERLAKMYLQLETWTLKKLDKLPSSAPVAAQLLEGLGEVRKRLRGKPQRGRGAVEAMIAAMGGLYTTDAPPLRRLWRKYDEVEEMLDKYHIR